MNVYEDLVNSDSSSSADTQHPETSTVTLLLRSLFVQYLADILTSPTISTAQLKL